ncbi:phage tail length tape measure family protein [Novosphingobium sp. KN65.2]|uniref:phage tail length tape measure family protein n=1 Tax=Novosphingobium sp. KN65.2 TaxID=1478134 RepID=UPI0005DE1B5E|nr:phage tail length tape measure family protein [Novosphingobium sp. KN65.2]CDO37150.1 conserved hypothetical protein [Novosphingobium sp. KN65.2]
MKAGQLEIEIMANVAKLQEDMRKVKKSVGDMTDEVGRKTRAANDNLGGFIRGVNGAGSSSRLASHHVQNLAFQFQDIAIGLQGGQKPLTVFLQQGSQIAGVMGQAGIGVKGLVVELLALAAPFAPIIAAAGALAATIGLVTAEINKNSKVTVTWQDTVLGAYDAAKSYVEGQLARAFEYFGISTKNVWDDVVSWTKWAVNRIIGITSLVPRIILDSWDQIPAGVADIFLTTVNGAIDAINALIRRSVSAVNAFITEANTILEKVGISLPKIGTPEIARVANSYAGAGVKLGSTVAKAVADTMQRDFIGDLAGAISPFAQARARARIEADAEKAGKAAGSKFGKAAGDQAVEDFLAKWQSGLLSDVAKQLAENQATDWKDFQDTLENWAKYGADEAARKADELTDALRASNDELRDMISLFSNLGGLGQGIGALLGIFTGNTSAVGGPIGQLLNIGTGQFAEKDGRKVAITIGDEISKIFKSDGDFAKTFTSVLQGAGTGLAAGQAIFGKQSTTEKLGSAIGGVLGKEAGKALGDVVGGTLGKALGPLGAIAGGILGSLVGGLFNKTPWGRVQVSSAGVSEAAGNSNSSERAALAFGGSVFGSLQDIADAFGGSVGDFGNITVGVRHGDYRVNTGGTSLKKKKGAVDFNDDAEAAIAYAIQQAIDRGAIQGVRASTANLLKASDDLQKNLEKALKFEGVFSELQSIQDPLGYALDNLTREFDQLRDIFDEAGASAEEYAKLEELLAIKRQDAIDEQMQQSLDKLTDQNSLEVELLNLLGRSEDALALSRLNELASTKAALQPMQALVYQLTDLNAIVNQFGPLADDLRAFKQELLGGSATNGFAFITQQFRDTAALAKGGDATALAALQNDANAYLEAARSNAASDLEYRRALGEVLAATDAGIFAADSQVEYAQMQIDAIYANADILTGIKDEIATYRQAVTDHQEWTERMFRRWDGEGLQIRNDEDTPIYTEAAA